MRRKALASERRRELYNWLREKPEHEGLTTRQIVDVPGVYKTGVGFMEDPMAQASRDLCALLSEGLVIRNDRPARWRVQERSAA